MQYRSGDEARRERSMPLENYRYPHSDGGDMLLWVTEPDGPVVRVRVLQAAIDDFCDPRGIDRRQEEFPDQLHKAVLDVTESAIQKLDAMPQELVITTSMLNP
jgi:hypothetical protein